MPVSARNMDDDAAEGAGDGVQVAPPGAPPGAGADAGHATCAAARPPQVGAGQHQHDDPAGDGFDHHAAAVAQHGQRVQVLHEGHHARGFVDGAVDVAGRRIEKHLPHIAVGLRDVHLHGVRGVVRQRDGFGVARFGAQRGRDQLRRRQRRPRAGVAQQQAGVDHVVYLLMEQIGGAGQRQ
ncbi:conserved hypothetical protein [Ricinus communis]|uniref:Uncharacterized protein n=1 Tax=Ricinus communis TaxID=3988 RepID=B9TQ93_RICCO|nr:conserved hypothetical protein [Ricinus communis]